MARNQIDDLPLDVALTPEELERILGAGRASLGIELEDREMCAAAIGRSPSAGLMPPRDPAPGDALVRTSSPSNEIYVGGRGGGNLRHTNSQFEGAGGGFAVQGAPSREWDEGGRHNKETIVANGDKVPTNRGHSATSGPPLGTAGQGETSLTSWGVTRSLIDRAMTTNG